MSKRFQPMKEFGRSMKKPKLDITINRRTVSDSITRTKPANTPTSAIKATTSDFWDDDDDDVILLATQVAEAAVAAVKGIGRVKELHDITESEITFSEFGNEASTSTQQQATNEIPRRDVLSQMFRDDDDDFELLAAVHMSEQVEFKKPPPPTSIPLTSSTIQVHDMTKSKATDETPILKEDASEDAVEFILSQNTGPESTLPSTQSAARRQLASERQIKFLMEKVDSLKKENLKLSKDITETKAKMSSKEGETSLLRDELRHLKQQAQALKMEKILCAQSAQNECQSKMDELARTVQAKETEVRMKEMECSLVKMRYEDDTQRLQQSIFDESLKQKPKVVQSTTSSMTKQQRRLSKSLIKMSNFNLFETLATQLEKCALKQINPLIYERSRDKGSCKKQRTLFQLELENMQTKLAQLQLLGVKKLPEMFASDCIDSASKVFAEFWSYIHSLEFPKNRHVHPYHDYSLTNTKCLQRDSDYVRCLQEPIELYDDERCLCLRRYLAALSILCEQLPALTSSLLIHKHGEYYLLQIVTDSVKKLGFAREICEHFGILEALSVWLNSLLLHVSLTTSKHILEMLVDLLKSLVFSRPSAWIFSELSNALSQRISRLLPALELLCVNSPESAFVTDRVRSTYRFSDESCLMQVYCGLLEIAFPLSTRLQLHHFKLLVVVCLNHVRFVYQCFQRPPKFIQKLLPLYDDEEDDFNSERSEEVPSCSTNNISDQNSKTPLEDESSPRCECYVKMCLSVVTLIFQVLRQWLFHNKENCTQQVAAISRLSVQLLHIIFCDNYLTCLFRDSEETTKHNLSLIVKWWSDNSNQLQFNLINMKFLQKLQNSHILPMDTTADTNYENISTDLSDWQNCTNDNVEHLKPPKNSEEAENYAKKLNLIEDISNQGKFFESLKGFAFNFQ